MDMWHAKRAEKSFANNNLSSIVIAVLFSIVCILAQSIITNQKQDETMEQNPMEKDQYNGYGLENGTELSKVIVGENDSLICYEDRILRKFSYDIENIERTSDLTRGLITRCPAIEHVYVVPIPQRIVTEEGYDSEKQLYQQYIDEISTNLPDEAEVVDVLPALEEHEGEYLFFRTEDSWTAKGAFYGMEELCNRMGIEAFPLSRYEEYMYNSFKGDLAYQVNMSNIQYDSWPYDRVYYYLIPGSENKAEIIYTTEDGNTICYKKPVITCSARNTGSFITSNYTRAIVEGETTEKSHKDKYVLVIGDETGKLLVPYLKDYYDGVYLVNVRQDRNFYTDIDEIVNQYQITEVVFAQRAVEMGKLGYDLALNEFCGQQ